MQCDVCGSELGEVSGHGPVYCIPCIEEMDKLNMSQKRYKKYREVQETLGKK